VRVDELPMSMASTSNSGMRPRMETFRTCPEDSANGSGMGCRV